MISGIINVNKADSITSFQVVSQVKKKLGIKKVGHLGTLDPAGSGVLPIAVGKATKLFDYFLNKKKLYRAYFYFGKETDTLDSEGVVTRHCEKQISISDINSVIGKLIGEIEQMPPKFSAKSINGVRAYELARNNIEFELKTKKVTIYKFEVIEQISHNLFLFEIECSAGTYIRSLCRDLAYLLETVAYMPLIIRLESGCFNIENSISYEELKNCANLRDYVIKIEDCFNYKKIVLNEIDAKKIKSGQKIPFNEDDGVFLLFENEDTFFALGQIKDKILKMELYFGD
ncbi:MAG: tRNA pseudouridine(55) synthase TruB [Christensenellales bacterium]